MVSILGLFPSSHCALFIALSLLSKRLTQGAAGIHFMIRKHDMFFGKVQASREFLGGGAYASLGIFKN